MSKILVATDFSQVAQHATHYACQLAATYDCSVHLVNAHMVPIAFSDTPVPILPLDETRQAAEEHMQRLVADLHAAFPQIAITGECFLGEAVDVLQDQCETLLPLMTILGNSGSADEGAWLGSVVLNGMRELSCPVLAVPEGFPFRQIQTICLACDADDLNGDLSLQPLLRLQQKLNAALELVSVRKEDAAPLNFEKSSLKAALQGQAVRLREVNGEDIAATVHRVAMELNADWLAVVPHRHNFLAGLFHKSQTKAILHESDLPILALPQR